MHNAVDKPWIIGVNKTNYKISLEINDILHLVGAMLMGTQYIGGGDKSKAETGLKS